MASEDYTKPIKGTAQAITITATPQTINDLLGGDPSEKANRLALYSEDGAGPTPEVWYTYDEDATPAPNNGIPIFSGGTLVLTAEQWKTAQFVKDSGPDVDMWCEQFDYEQQKT